MPADLTLHYGPHPDHLVDVRLPHQDGPRPVVVVVHGGFWKEAFDRTHAAAQSDAFAAAGYVVATVEYRRVGQSGGGWPGTLDDIARVSDALPALLDDTIGDRVDSARCVLVGHSAGGHLATWTASRHALPRDSSWWRPEPLPIRGVVSLAGVVDLAVADRLHLGGNATRGLLGGRLKRHGDRLRLADPVGLLPTGVNVQLIHGAEDDTVPLEVSRSFAAQARAVGDPGELHELTGVSHADVIDPASRAWPAVLAAVSALLGSTD